MKKALITGITGQDGSYLAELLLFKEYEVHGLIRRASTFNTSRIDHLYSDPHNETRLFLHYGDMGSTGSLQNLIYEIEPHEIYHLAAQSHVRVSFDLPDYTTDVTGLGTVRILEAVRRSGVRARFYQASSSEMFGSAPSPQDESTPFHPQSPYATAKLFGYWASRNYRQAYQIFASNGILFNHESPRRGETFVTRKITRALAAIVGGRQKHLFLGNLDAKRDWGYAPDYVEAMVMMLQQEQPDDFVIGTGESHTVGEFLEEAFEYVSLNWKDHVKIDSRYYRPNEVESLQANPAKAIRQLGWTPKVRFSELVRIMVDADLEAEGLPSPGAGKDILEKHFDGWHRWDLETARSEKLRHATLPD